MKKVGISLLVLLISLNASGQVSEKNLSQTLNQSYSLFKSGEVLLAENLLTPFINQIGSVPEYCRFYIYNAMGSITLLTGRYIDAKSYLDRAGSSLRNGNDSIQYLGSLYLNYGLLYNNLEIYDLASEYFEKSIREIKKKELRGYNADDELSTVYQDLGITLLQTGKYDEALKYLKESRKLMVKAKPGSVPFTDLNIARIYIKLHRTEEADRLFRQAASSLQNIYGRDYYRLPIIYFEFSNFLFDNDRKEESYDLLQKALGICLKNFGNNHPMTSRTYKYIGDYFIKTGNPDSALSEYQRSLISIVPGFTNRDVYSNPSGDTSLFDIRLLDNLKGKASALLELSEKTKDSSFKVRMLEKGTETIELALKVIDRLRNSYINEESRIYLAGNEKGTYLQAIRIAEELYGITGNRSAVDDMYRFARRSKSMVLRDEIKENEVLFSKVIPDTLISRHLEVVNRCSGYLEMISRESDNRYPDSTRIASWKDSLFRMNRLKEKLNSYIAVKHPRINEILGKTDSAPVSGIQARLGTANTILDYFLFNTDVNGSSDLYTFILRGDRISYLKQSVDSGFFRRSALIRSGSNKQQGSTDVVGYTEALGFMYRTLVQPVEKQIKGTSLIIIPDEEIWWLPFESFMIQDRHETTAGFNITSFLVCKYTISYALSLPLVFGRKANGRTTVNCFSPEYGPGNEDRMLENLPGAQKESEEIFRWFTGRRFNGNQATKERFRDAIGEESLLHLAMHTLEDSSDSRYSYLQFEPGPGNEKGRMYNYEISFSRVQSRMVVLSTCNSGTGNLYHGEGIMSMARSFQLAGAATVVKSDWEMNDQSGSEIIKRFYYYLHRGGSAASALRRAKLDWLKNASPAYMAPYYWAGYELLGDPSPVRRRNGISLLLEIVIVMVITASFSLYLRRRRISPAREE